MFSVFSLFAVYRFFFQTRKKRKTLVGTVILPKVRNTMLIQVSTVDPEDRKSRLKKRECFPVLAKF